jgi:hypothetical protein
VVFLISQDFVWLRCLYTRRRIEIFQFKLKIRRCASTVFLQLLMQICSSRCTRLIHQRQTTTLAECCRSYFHVSVHWNAFVSLNRFAGPVPSDRLNICVRQTTFVQCRNDRSTNTVVCVCSTKSSVFAQSFHQVAKPMLAALSSVTEPFASTIRRGVSDREQAIGKLDTFCNNGFYG